MASNDKVESKPFGKMTDEERAAALKKAREARAKRAEMLGRVKTGEMSFADFLASAENDRVAARTYVKQLLLAVPGIGMAKRDQIMVSIGVSSTRRVGGLGPRQRESLLEAVSNEK